MNVIHTRDKVCSMKQTSSYFVLGDAVLSINVHKVLKPNEMISKTSYIS